MQYIGNLGGGSAATLAILEKLEALEAENQNLKASKINAINTKRVLKLRTFVADEPSSYTATQDCWVQVVIKAANKTGGNASINNVVVKSLYTEGSYIESVDFFYLSKGETIKVTGNSINAASYAVYGTK